ncbi:MBL fold metallo-hydrolase [Inquilinus limosus]|uniref:MBL fold metallo-hydrolase n=1 Tax=Inquilinus limosus TaxID=171674 RepID=UPI0003FE766C|nr:MBL fold metallo-hydrolase [Inquilinus limosus]
MSLTRRHVLAAALAAPALPLLASLPQPVLARAVPPAGQVPGLYRFKVGAFEVTSINDGMLNITLDQFPAADRAGAEALLQRAFQPPAAIPTAVNAYLVNTGDRLVLIDTGTAAAMGPSLGKVGANLKAVGVDPADVDLVVLTHMHPDHANGLIDPAGAAVFGKAELAVAEAEYGFWTDDGILSRAPAEVHPFFAMARAAVKPYAGDRLTRFGKEAEIAPGIRVLAAPGHTPGHSMIEVTSGDDRLLIWGDIVHAAALQFAKPDWAINFDVDQQAAIASRKRVLDRVAADRVLIAGAHLAFPGIGHVGRVGDGYEFVPAFWQP